MTKEPVSFRVDPDIAHLIEEAAAADGHTVSEELRERIVESFEREQPKPRFPSREKVERVNARFRLEAGE